MELNLNRRADELAAHLKRFSENHGGPVTVAIDGCSGAGKSTFADLLKDRLNAVVLAGDDFFAGGVDIRRDPPAVLAADCIDWRRQKAVLKSLTNEGFAQYHSFDWDAFDGSNCDHSKIVKARQFVISEGTYSARPELRELCDILIFLDIDDDVRIRQLWDREGQIGDWEKQWHLAEKWYFQHWSPRDIFDVVVSEKRCYGIRP